MKNVIILLSLIYTFNFFGQEVNGIGEAHYKKSYIASKNTKQESHLSDFEKYTIKALDRILFVLKFNRTESLFRMAEQMNLDDGLDLRSATLIGGGKGVYYTNIDENVRLHQKVSFEKKYIVESSFKKLQWELLNKSKNIGGYACYQAKLVEKIVTSRGVKDRIITAWYAPDLSISFGPIGYGNLPGLIMELVVGKKTVYTCTRIIFDTSKKISRPKKGLLISEPAFNIISKETLEKLKEKEDH